MVVTSSCLVLTNTFHFSWLLSTKTIAQSNACSSHKDKMTKCFTYSTCPLCGWCMQVQEQCLELVLLSTNFKLQYCFCCFSPTCIAERTASKGMCLNARLSDCNVMKPLVWPLFWAVHERMALCGLWVICVQIGSSLSKPLSGAHV